MPLTEEEWTSFAPSVKQVAISLEGLSNWSLYCIIMKATTAKDTRSALGNEIPFWQG